MPVHFADSRTLCTAPPPRETETDDLTLHTLRTLIAQNVWAPPDANRGDSLDVTLLDELGEEDPTGPPPRPYWRAPTWALPDGEKDPTISVPDYEHYSGVPRGSLPPVGNPPDSWGPVGPMNRDNWRATVLTLTTRLPFTFDWLPGDAESAMGVVRGAHGHEWGDFLRRSGGIVKGAPKRLMAVYLTCRGIPLPHRLVPVAQRAQQPLVPPPQPGTYGNAAVARMTAGGARHHSSSTSTRRTATITTQPRSRTTAATMATNVRALPPSETGAPQSPTTSTSSSRSTSTSTDATRTTGVPAPSGACKPQSPRQERASKRAAQQHQPQHHTATPNEHPNNPTTHQPDRQYSRLKHHLAVTGPAARTPTRTRRTPPSRLTPHGQTRQARSSRQGSRIPRAEHRQQGAPRRRGVATRGHWQATGEANPGRQACAIAKPKR